VTTLTQRLDEAGDKFGISISASRPVWFAASHLPSTCTPVVGVASAIMGAEALAERVAGDSDSTLTDAESENLENNTNAAE
jgi:hypothetical protein